MTAARTPALRRLSRALATTAALLVALLVALSASPASASAPEGWEDPEKVSTLHVILLLAGGPLLLFALIATLVYLPSVVRGQRSETGLAWRDRPEWFGGPRKGVDAVVDPAVDVAAPADQPQVQDRGGASAHW